ncbi:MAG: hypothetical protein LC708_02345 [Actinobacteria bacterium]|nr:hypothetical protein [Actinomycetota bacterium]
MKRRPLRGRLFAPILLALFVVLAGGACQVRVTGGIDVDPDGGGTVRAGLGLDAEALAIVGDVGAALRVDDLRQAGWKIDGPSKEDDGLTWVRVSRPVSDTEEAATALAQLSGPEGPLRDLKITSSRTLLRNRTSLSGAVDLSGGLSGLADADLISKIGGAVPLDLEGLRKEFGPDLDRVVQVSFEARLPGSADANTTEKVGGRFVWRPPLGERADIAASSQGLNLLPLVAVAVVLLVAVGAGTGWLLVRRRR